MLLALLETLSLLGLADEPHTLRAGRLGECTGKVGCSYNGWCSGARAGSGAVRVHGINEGGSRHKRRLARVAGLYGVDGSGEVEALKHVLTDGVEENIEGQLGQAALAFRAEDRMCLAC